MESKIISDQKKIYFKINLKKLEKKIKILLTETNFTLKIKKSKAERYIFSIMNKRTLSRGDAREPKRVASERASHADVL